MLITDSIFLIRLIIIVIFLTILTGLFAIIHTAFINSKINKDDKDE